MCTSVPGGEAPVIVSGSSTSLPWRGAVITTGSVAWSRPADGIVWGGPPGAPVTTAGTAGTGAGAPAGPGEPEGPGGAAGWSGDGATGAAGAAPPSGCVPRMNTSGRLVQPAAEVSVAQTVACTTPSGDAQSSLPISGRICFMNAAHVRAGRLPPVTLFIGESSSLPTQTPATIEGVNPMNHALR